MKKNLVPLVIIALVVAVVSTGIFYGLIVSRMDGSPKAAMVPRYVAATALAKDHVLKPQDFRLTNVASSGIRGPQTAEELEGRTLLEPIEAGQEFQDSNLSPITNRALPGGIPAGQRAVTVHISEASSVVQMLKTGDRVDVQALVGRNRNGENDLELKTILQNATVFTIAAVENGGNPQARSILTLLASPQDAERLTLADAGARLRVVLRNRKDESLLPLNAIQLSNLTSSVRVSSGKVVDKSVEKALVSSQFLPGSFPNGSLPNGPLPNGSVPSGPVAKKANPLEFEVELVEVASDEVAGFAPAARDGVLQVSSTQPETNAAESLGKLKSGQKMRVVASAKLAGGRTGEFAWKSSMSDKEYSSLRLRVEAMGHGEDGVLQLRLEPESNSPKGGAMATRRVDSNVSLNSKQAAVVSGLFSAEELVRMRQGLSPAEAGRKGEWMLIVTPKPALVPVLGKNPNAAVGAVPVAQR